MTAFENDILKSSAESKDRDVLLIWKENMSFPVILCLDRGQPDRLKSV